MLSQTFIAYLVAACVLTVTPGVDTALVLRAATQGPSHAYLAAVGVGLGCLVWGALVAVGVGALILASPLAFEILKWLGAAYLFWLGLHLILKPRRSFERDAGDGEGMFTWFRRGLVGNLLNPKVGVFYVSFLPQFVPPDVSAGTYTFFLAGVHVALGLVWCTALILATRPLARLLRRPSIIAGIDRLTGCIFLGFGVRLAFWSGRG